MPNLTTGRAIIGYQQITTINDSTRRNQSIFYVDSLLKDTKVKEKLLGDSPDRLAMGGLSPLLIK